MVANDPTLLAILVDYEILLSGKSFSGKNKVEPLVQTYIKPILSLYAQTMRGWNKQLNTNRGKGVDKKLPIKYET